MPDNRKQVIQTKYGDFEISPMQVSETYKRVLDYLLDTEFLLSESDFYPGPWDDVKYVIVRVWDRMRK